MLIFNQFIGKEAKGQEPLEQRVAQVRRLIEEADYVLIGAGAGLSAAAGLTYSGEEFEREFRPWIERYHIKDLYTSSFYPFPTEEEKWAYWARHIWYARFRPEAMPLYKALLELVWGKDYFVLTTNVDAQFEKAGFEKARIFATQGDYAYFQPASGSPKKLYYNEQMVMRMLDATTDCRIPTELVPKVPETGKPLAPNLRSDDTFVEDAYWHEQAYRYCQFRDKASAHKLLLLEFGVGFNTPGIIRFPFERLAAENDDTTLVRFNRDYPQLAFPQLKRYVVFQETLDVELLKRLK